MVEYFDVQIYHVAAAARQQQAVDHGLDDQLDGGFMKRERSSARPVIIVGGGIAGPAAAIALRRSGIESVIYEATPAHRDQAGAFLNVAPNGLRMLETLGVRSEIEAFGFQNDRLSFRNDS